FNEGLMELGAVVCTPGRPKCLSCPLKSRCAAFERNEQDEIPARSVKPERPVVHHTAVVVRAQGVDGDAFHVEQRASKGLWAGLWQAPTLETQREATIEELRAFVAQRLGVAKRSIRAGDLAAREGFTRVTRSSVVRFAAYDLVRPVEPSGATRAVARADLLAGEPPLAVPHRRILLGETA